MKKVFSLRSKDYRSEVAATGARDMQKQRKKRNRKKRKKQKQDRTTKTRSKCIECKCVARTSLHGWARGMCMTHVIKNRLKIPQKNRLEIPLIKKKAKKEKKPMQGAVKKEHVKKSKKFCKPLGADTDKDLDSDTQKEHDEEDFYEGIEFDEPEVKVKMEQNVTKKVKKISKPKAKKEIKKKVKLKNEQVQRPKEQVQKVKVKKKKIMAETAGAEAKQTIGVQGNIRVQPGTGPKINYIRGCTGTS